MGCHESRGWWVLGCMWILSGWSLLPAPSKIVLSTSVRKGVYVRVFQAQSSPCMPGKAVWGESGELVCTKPIPCQPTHFWNDENGSKYRKAYFSKFPGRWEQAGTAPCLARAWLLQLPVALSISSVPA